MKVNPAKEAALSVDRVRELFDYNPETGAMTRKSGPRKGYALGSNSSSRLYTIIDGVSYSLARVIWLHYYGEWPKGLVDHKDTKESNNRIANLREATYAQNCQNRIGSRFAQGVTFKAGCILPWLARITVENTRIVIGYFASREEGISAYKEACLRYHGEFANRLASK